MPGPEPHAIWSSGIGEGKRRLDRGSAALVATGVVGGFAVLDRRKGVLSLGRLWGLTLLGNVIALAILAWLFSRAGVVPPETRTAAGKLANTIVDRDVLPAVLSAIVAGIVMTTFTWMAAAAETDVARVVVALLIGFVLVAPSLN